MTLDPSLSLMARVLLALVFSFAVYGKVHHRDVYVGVVANYRLLPESWVPAVAWSVLGLEALVVGCLTSGLELRTGAVLAALLLGVFAVAMAINVARGRTQIDCGCFQSALRQPLSVVLVMRNLLLAGLAMTIIVPTSYDAGLLQWLDGVGAGCVLFVLYQVLGQLMALRAAARVIQKRFA